MKLYISPPAMWLLAVFYAPLVLFLIWKLWRRLKLSAVKRVAVCVGALLVAAAIPLWDVVVTSYYMAQLCPEAGITVNRTVKVDGYYANAGGPDLLDRGFKYVEVDRSYKIDVYRKIDGTVRHEEFDKKRSTYTPVSRYEEIIGHETRWSGRRDIGVTIDVIRDRVTGEELGRAVMYAAYPGWIDRNTFALLGQVRWACPSDRFGYALALGVDLKRQVLLPRKD